MWYIPFKIFFVTAQKPIFQTRDDLCDNEDIMAKPLRGHPCKSLAEFAMNATPGRRVTPPWDVYMANCHPGQQGNPTWQTRPHLSCKRDQNKIRNYIDRRVTSPTWGPPPPCKQALIRLALMHHLINGVFFVALLPGNVTEHERNEKQRGKKWSLPISHMHIRSVIPAKKKASIFMEKVFDLTGRSIWKSKRKMARLVKSKW